jgi:hypothetical protein
MPLVEKSTAYKALSGRLMILIISHSTVRLLMRFLLREKHIMLGTLITAATNP